VTAGRAPLTAGRAPSHRLRLVRRQRLRAGRNNVVLEGRGPITYVAGKDTTGTVQPMLDRWNGPHPKEKVTFIRLPSDADAQRRQIFQNAETKSDACTVLSLDVVWTSEFAAHQWLDKLPERQFPLRRMLKPVVETAKYRGGLYAAPAGSDGGMLYYRTDLLKKAGGLQHTSHGGGADIGRRLHVEGNPVTGCLGRTGDSDFPSLAVRSGSGLGSVRGGRVLRRR
jgi:hypothetical protein